MQRRRGFYRYPKPHSLGFCFIRPINNWGCLPISLFTSTDTPPAFASTQWLLYVLTQQSALHTDFTFSANYSKSVIYARPAWRREADRWQAQGRPWSGSTQVCLHRLLFLVLDQRRFSLSLVNLWLLVIVWADGTFASVTVFNSLLWFLMRRSPCDPSVNACWSSRK